MRKSRSDLLLEAGSGSSSVNELLGGHVDGLGGVFEGLLGLGVGVGLGTGRGDQVRGGSTDVAGSSDELFLLDLEKLRDEEKWTRAGRGHGGEVTSAETIMWKVSRTLLPWTDSWVTLERVVTEPDMPWAAEMRPLAQAGSAWYL